MITCPVFFVYVEDGSSRGRSRLARQGRSPAQRLGYLPPGTMADSSALQTVSGSFCAVHFQEDRDINRVTAVSSPGVGFRAQHPKGVWQSGIRDRHTP